MKDIYNEKKYICLVANSLSSGGIKSTFENIAQLWLSIGMTIDVYTKDGTRFSAVEDENIHYYKLKEPNKLEKIYLLFKTFAFIDLLLFRISGTNLYSKRTQKYNIELVKRMNRIKNSYDVAVAMHEFFPTYYVASNIWADKKICWEHPRFDAFNIDYKLEYFTYKQYSKIITVSNGCKDVFCNIFPELFSRTIVINNIIDTELINRKALESIEDDYLFETDTFIICSVCRLDNSSKRIDRMVDIAAKLKFNGMKFKWIVVGEGTDRVFIEKKIRKMKVGDVFILLGNKENPYPYIKKSTLFINTSQYEGYPISVLEALALGKKVIATNCTDYEDEIKEKIIIVDNCEKRVVNEMSNMINKIYIDKSLTTKKINFYKNNIEKQLIKLIVS